VSILNERPLPPELKRYSVESIENLYAQLMDLSPKIVTMFTPSNRAEQEKKFLSGKVRNPSLFMKNWVRLILEQR